jgi:LPS O-antigen subunit length determinant protein (WzzB/FepE family)
MRALAAVVFAALALVACGESPEDQARDDGERAGEAVRALYDAETPEGAQSAVDELTAVRDDLDEDIREHVQDEISVQSESLQAAAEALQGGDRAALQSAIQDVRAQADSFTSQDDSIANEFWRGFEEGYDD